MRSHSITAGGEVAAGGVAASQEEDGDTDMMGHSLEWHGARMVFSQEGDTHRCFRRFLI